MLPRCPQLAASQLQALQRVPPPAPAPAPAPPPSLAQLQAQARALLAPPPPPPQLHPEGRAWSVRDI